MASKVNNLPTTATTSGDEIIQIVRREIVGEVRLSHSGSVHPLAAAFAIAADYIAENENASGVALEWEMFGQTYRASADPAPDNSSKNAEDALGDPYGTSY